jgi:hypothetical protein
VTKAKAARVEQRPWRAPPNRESPRQAGSHPSGALPVKATGMVGAAPLADGEATLSANLGETVTPTEARAGGRAWTST